MKTLILSIINGLFTKESNESTRHNEDSIFLKETDSNTSRTIIIEEDKYNVWVYLLSIDKQEIDFDGFLCAVVNPLKVNGNNDKVSKKETALPIKFANKYSWVKNLKREHIKIDWQKNMVKIWIKDKVYLVMNMNTKTSYSKALSKDCDYGKKLVANI